MAHTPFFATLRRSLRLAATLERHGFSTGDGLERIEAARATGLSRRDFMKTAGLAAAGAAFAPDPARLPVNINAATAPNVVIVGAGVAGLTAAYRLGRAGVKARVFEASKRVGGRMETSRGNFPGGQIAEKGGEFIDSGHDALRALARELGLGLADLAADRGLIDELFYFGGKLYKSDDLLTDFRAVAKAAADDMEPFGDKTIDYKTPNGGEALDNLSIAAWFDKHDIKGTIRDMLTVAYTGEYGLEIGEQSSLNLLTLIGSGEEKIDLFGESDERYHIRGGNDQVPTRLNQRIPRPVELEQVLEAVAPGTNGGYTLTFRKGATSTDVQADAVILTLPFSTLRKVDLSKLDLPAAKLNAINNLGYGASSKVMAGFKTRVWKQQKSTGSVYTDLPFEQSWETVRYQGGTRGILTDFFGGDKALAILDVDGAQAAADFAKQLENIYKGAQAAFDPAAVLVADWPRQPFALGGYSCWKVGQFTTVKGAEPEPVGKLFFAGEHTSADYQGYMNGGVESGERAVAELLEAVGIKTGK